LNPELKVLSRKSFRGDFLHRSGAISDEKGRRMEQFPGIIFRSGPAGRRAGVAGGPDVWEIVRDLKRAAMEGAKDSIDAVMNVTGLDRARIELAAAYYAAHPDEVAERIRLTESESIRLQRRSMT
jgi:hypothetical protein